jgi:hypothetical protein
MQIGWIIAIYYIFRHDLREAHSRSRCSLPARRSFQHVSIRLLYTSCFEILVEELFELVVHGEHFLLTTLQGVLLDSVKYRTDGLRKGIARFGLASHVSLK